jgi:hypothetical protein
MRRSLALVLPTLLLYFYIINNNGSHSGTRMSHQATRAGQGKSRDTIERVIVYSLLILALSPIIAN